jgi:L-lactate dehydrogenase complex protein LldG
MIGARERILGRLRSAQGTTATPASTATTATTATRPTTTANSTAPTQANQTTKPGIAQATLDQRIDAHYAQWRTLRDATPAQQIDAFEAALVAAHAEVWRASETQWAAKLAYEIAHAGVQRLLLDTKRAEGAALAAALPTEVEPVVFDRPLETWKAELFDTVAAGFTVARSGIASTGTLVIFPDAGSPRTMSVAPPLHIALVYGDTLHRDLHEAARMERWSDDMPTNLVLVSGPSKTSDIQQTLAYGAHGPRRLWVVIVTDEQPADMALGVHR